MKRWKILVGLVAILLVGYLFLGAAGDGTINTKPVLGLTDDYSGENDTAEIDSICRFTGRDGFAYKDTLRPGASGSKTAVVWTSPMTVRRIAVAVSVDTSYEDTLIIDLGTNTDTVAFDVGAEGVQYTRAQYIDSLVARIDGLTESADTVDAEDSSTYIKLVSKIAQDALEGDARWTLAFGTGSNNMSESDSTFTTPAMVCDSMVYKINNTAAIKDSITARDSTTYYTVTGRPGYDMYVTVGDTAQNVGALRAAVNGVSEFYDTVPFMNLYQSGHRSMIGSIILSHQSFTDGGFALVDSAAVVLKSWTPSGGYLKIDSTWGAIPCTLHVSQVANDTIWGLGTYIIWHVQDTASDYNGVTISPQYMITPKVVAH